MSLSFLSYTAPRKQTMALFTLCLKADIQSIYESFSSIVWMASSKE
jgi:hypothetical protein